jgi:hypothetical protein
MRKEKRQISHVLSHMWSLEFLVFVFGFGFLMARCGWLLTSVIPATREAEMGGSWLEVSLGKKLARSHYDKSAIYVGACLWFQLHGSYRS